MKSLCWRGNLDDPRKGTVASIPLRRGDLHMAKMALHAACFISFGVPRVASLLRRAGIVAKSASLTFEPLICV